MGLPEIGTYNTPLIDRTDLNRTTWRIEPQRAALLVHDMQQYFIDAFTADHAAMHTARKNTARLIQHARERGLPIYFTAQPPQQDAAHRQLLTDFWGPGLQTEAQARIVADLTPEPTDTVLTKWRYSAFARTPLLDELASAGRDQLIVTGIYAHIGCLTTATVAFMADVQAFLVNDAMADFSHKDHQLALDYAATRCAHVLDTADVLADLAQKPAYTSAKISANVSANISVLA